MEELLYITVALIIILLVYQNISIRASIRRLTVPPSVVSRSAQLQSVMELEFERARRLDYMFSIVVITLAKRVVWNVSPDDVLRILADEDSAVRRSDDSAPPGTINIFRSSSDKIAVKLRATDTAVYDAQKNRFIMLLVGTRKHDAARIAEQITASLARNLQQEVSFGSAEFPADGLFLDDLIAATESETVFPKTEEPPRSNSSVV